MAPALFQPHFALAAQTNIFFEVVTVGVLSSLNIRFWQGSAQPPACPFQKMDFCGPLIGPIGLSMYRPRSPDRAGYHGNKKRHSGNRMAAHLASST